MGIADLVNDIQGSISGLVADIKGDSSRAVNYLQGVADFKAVQSQLNQGSWNKLIFPYTFSVVNLNNPQDSGGFSDFQLPLAPQTINQKEVPAISIQPTQGGTTVNHSGLGYKSLSMSGTTGIAPFRGDGGVNRKTGEAIFQPKDLKFKSGYEVFIHLRNWFRTYYEWKHKLGKQSANHRLIFKNYKDGEFLIVELEAFEMDRNASRSFLYDYKLEFKVLSHYSFKKPGSKTGFLEDTDALIENALDKITTARGIFLRTQGILRQIESTYDASVLEPLRQATLALKAALGVPILAVDISSRTIVNTISTAKALEIMARETVNFATLGLTGNSDTLASINGLVDRRITGPNSPVQNLLNDVVSGIKHAGSVALMTLGALMTKFEVGNFPEKAIKITTDEQLTAVALPRNFYEDTIKNLERVKQNAEDFFNLGSPEYDALFGRTSTLNADFTKTVTNDEYDVLFGFNEAITGIYSMLSTTDLFKSSFDDRITDIVDRFNGNIDLVSSPAVKQIDLPLGITLERLAQQELGDSTRWAEIAEVNNLKAPYISEDPKESRDGVLKPGDKILIPVPLQSGFSQAPVGKENKLLKDLSEVEKSLGVDFKIDSNFDLIIGSSGDLELVAGTDNLAQGTILKLSYDPGEVMLYPELGAGTTPGRKFPPLDELKDRVVNSLLQDARISKVSDISLVRSGSELDLSFNLFVKQIDLPIPIVIKV